MSIVNFFKWLFGSNVMRSDVVYVDYNGTAITSNGVKALVAALRARNLEYEVKLQQSYTDHRATQRELAKLQRAYDGLLACQEGSRILKAPKWFGDFKRVPVDFHNVDIFKA